jgi:NADH-quinone oxidoreductase subunit G
VDILPNRSTPFAAVVLPGSAWIEKRGSMVNIRGRLQRLNQATLPPAEARNDWEILCDILRVTGGSNLPSTIEEVFKQMSAAHAAFGGLTLSKIGDLGVSIADSLPPSDH